MKLFYLLVLFCQYVSVLPFTIGGGTHEYNKYLNDFQKTYSSSPEYWNHYYSFHNNMQKITNHNNANHSWKMGVNKFTDLSPFEFKNTYLKAKPPKPYLYPPSAPPNPNLNIESLPDAVDWRDKNLVTPIKDQGQCGSCWAFSAVGAMEGAQAKKSGVLTSLSEQNLVDCAGNFGCEGCEGGWMSAAMEYVHYNHGLDTENAYPYTAVDGDCVYNPNVSGTTVQSVVNLTAGDTDALLHAVATVGPVSVAIDAESDFQSYESGIYTSTDCSKDYLDHGVLVVGYGANDQGKYYIVKNSWGTSWGMDGYIYWNRDIPNMCGIAQVVSYPLLI